MQIEQAKTNSLIPYINNPRHNEGAVDKVAASIREFGFRQPIVVDKEKTIIAGHTRHLAAQKLGLELVPIHIAENLTDAQIKAYRIADNRVSEDAEWNMDKLKIELSDLPDFDLSILGFDDKQLSDILVEPVEGLTDEDAVPELPEEPTTVLGDVWILGNHRLMCGDSTSLDAVDKLMDGQKADLLFTSPPYAQQRDYCAAKEAVQDWDTLMNGVFNELPVKDGAAVLVNLGLVHKGGKVSSYWDNWIEYMNGKDRPLFGWYVWDQGHGMPGNWNGRLAPSHEFIFHFAKKPNQSNKWVDKKPESITHNGKGRTFRQKDGTMKKIYSPETSMQPTKVADSVIRVNRNPSEASDTGHPATFPTKLCEYLYNSFAKAGDIVYEPFCGAGTSVIACEKFAVKCYGMELDPKYCDVIIKRWEDYTGKKAQLDHREEAA